VNNYAVFGRHCFRKHRSFYDRRSLLNVALFDVMSVILAHYPKKHVVARKDKIQKAFYQLLDDGLFNDAISFATNSSKKVQTRFERARQFLIPAVENVD